MKLLLMTRQYQHKENLLNLVTMAGSDFKSPQRKIKVKKVYQQTAMQGAYMINANQKLFICLLTAWRVHYAIL
jgi:hypothetical protein